MVRWIDAETGDVWHMDEAGNIVPGVYVHPTCNLSGDCTPPSDRNRFNVSRREDGTITIEYFVVCTGPICDQGAPGPDGTIQFIRNSSGGFDTIGLVNPFPNLEAYHWKDGTLQSPYLFRRNHFSQEEMEGGVAHFRTGLGMFGGADTIFADRWYSIARRGLTITVSPGR